MGVLRRTCHRPTALMPAQTLVQMGQLPVSSMQRRLLKQRWTQLQAALRSALMAHRHPLQAQPPHPKARCLTP